MSRHLQSNLTRHHVVRWQPREHWQAAKNKTLLMLLVGFHRDKLLIVGFDQTLSVLGWCWTCFEANSLEWVKLFLFFNWMLIATSTFLCLYFYTFYTIYASTLSMHYFLCVYTFYACKYIHWHCVERRINNYTYVPFSIWLGSFLYGPELVYVRTFE